MGGGMRMTPGIMGPMYWRNTASPPALMASRDAPWKESQRETTLCFPVTTRANFKSNTDDGSATRSKQKLGLNLQGAGRLVFPQRKPPFHW